MKPARRIPVGSLQLNVTDRGSGRPVLLLHGFPDSLGMWREVEAALVRGGYRVIAYDQRGFGESDAPAGRSHYSIAQLVGDAAGLLQALAVTEPVHVIGHDWGAVIGWCLCLTRPDLVRSQVAISVGHPRAYALAGLEQKRKGLYVFGFQFVGLAEAWLRRDGFQGLRRWAHSHPDPETCVQELSRPGRLTAGLNWYRANLIRVLFGRWPLCTVPTLGVWSSGDDFLAEDQMRDSSTLMQAPWEYLRIEGAGHWLPIEQPQAVASRALDWFARHH